MNNPPRHRRDRLSSIQDEVKELHPLLKRLLNKLPNVKKVEYTHGGVERGADFVFAKHHEVLNTVDYVGVIAKVGKVSQDHTDIDRQITECEIERPFDGGKKKIRLSEVWVVITGTITAGAQEAIYEKFKSSKLYFVNGDALGDLVDQYAPDYWSDIDLDIGEYLTNLRRGIGSATESANLIHTQDEHLYIPQDVARVTEGTYSVQARSRKRRLEKIDIYDDIDRQEVMLLEGPMGSGKSRLVRRLVGHFCDAEVFKLKRTIPILLNYRDYIERFSGDLKSVLLSVDPKVRAHADEIKASYLFLLDGVDEKRQTLDEQIETIDALATATRAMPRAKCLITSRFLSPVGAASAPAADIIRYELSPLTLPKIYLFLEKLCTKLKVENRILEDLRRSQLFKQIPRSPIAAILLAQLLNERSQELPSTMTELYAKYSELMMGRWDIDKGLQSQTEYEVLDNVLTQLAEYFIDNELDFVSVAEFRDMMARYLSLRNLSLDCDELLKKAIERCELIAINEFHNVVFRHRTFAEYLYARSMQRKAQSWNSERALEGYWTNVYFFLLGIQKDSPLLLEQIIDGQADDEGSRWMRLINLPTFMLAAYMTPYDLVARGVERGIVDAARLYRDIREGRLDSRLSGLPPLHLLYVVQHFVRTYYSYTFFKNALENVALSIDDSQESDAVKAYALFFLSVTTIELKMGDPFDFLLKRHAAHLPTEVMLAIGAEGDQLERKSTLLKKQGKRMKQMLGDKNRRAVQQLIASMIQKPIRKQIQDKPAKNKT